MIELIEFEPEHLAMIENPRNDLCVAHRRFDLDYARFLKTAGPVLTGLMDGKVLGCAGIITYWEGVGEAWMFADERVSKNRFDMHRVLRAGLKAAKMDYNFHRIQAAVATLAPDNWKRWLEKLGFMREGPLWKYGPGGEDYERFAWVKG